MRTLQTGKRLLRIGPETGSATLQTFKTLRGIYQGGASGQRPLLSSTSFTENTMACGGQATSVSHNSFPGSFPCGLGYVQSSKHACCAKSCSNCSDGVI